MTALEFRFASNQQHQQETIEATCSLFRGQQFSKNSFTVDLGNNGMTKFGKHVKDYGNEIWIAPEKLRKNLHSVQEESCLPPTSVFTDGRLRDFTIRMETGIGETYVHIRTIYGFNHRYGITKFIIVVPNVTIHEGVLRSFQTTRKHFEVLYDRTPFDYFICDSKNMGSVDNFATSSSIQVMIINIDVFNKGLEEDGTAKGGSLFHRHSEKLGGGFSPCELVSTCTPVVVTDELQSVGNTKQAKATIEGLNPLFVLRYSATHKQTYDIIYRLTPVESFERHLVKGICVDSVKATTNLNGAYMRLEPVKSNSFSAKVSVDVRQTNGTQKRKTVTARTGADLYQKSDENTDYENGWVVNNIGAVKGNEFIEFQNDEVLELDGALGGADDEIVKCAQIHRAIENHSARQFEVWPRGVKVLSLFFIDRVGRYRVYEPEVHSGFYVQMFEGEYANALNSKISLHVSKAAGIDKGAWKECYEAVGAPLVADSHSVHQDYFARDKKGKFKDSKGTASTVDDTGAFALIMRKKETLTSFSDNKDEDRNISFIFSHSILRGGRDNPNVLQICTLVETKDNLIKRQKVGHGLRLCVNQDGERLYDPESSMLTVIANESYDEFASGLQKKFKVTNFEFGIVIAQSFTKVLLTDANGIEERSDYKKSKQIYDYLVTTGMVDSNSTVAPGLQAAAENDVLELPPELKPTREQIEAIIIQKSQKIQIHDKANEVSVELHKDVALYPAFQALWDRIRRHTRLQVNIDSEKLIREAAAAVESMLPVHPPQVTSGRASLSVDDSGLTTEGTATSPVNVTGQMKYDLPDPIVGLQDAVGLTRGAIKMILERCNHLDEFEVDPAASLAQVGGRINRVRNDLIAKSIKYVKLPEEEWYTMHDLELDGYTAYIGQNTWKPKNAEKSLYSYVVYDSAGVELPFAEALDKQEEVLVFAKLPPTFKIDTPLSSYNPDWAYVEGVSGEHHVHFVTRTKGGENGEPVPRDAEKLRIGYVKKRFEALDLGSDFHYNVRITCKYEATDA